MTTKKAIDIKKALQLLSEYTGLELNLCDYFTGIQEHNKQKYYNIILSQRTSESQEYDKLQKFANKYKLIRIEPNGLKRVAIYFNCL